MIFYRFEKNDGGGPFFSRDGTNRTTGEKDNSDTLDGCFSVEDLKKWFCDRKIDVSDCSVKKYEGELIYMNKNLESAVFKKSTAILLI